MYKIETFVKTLFFVTRNLRNERFCRKSNNTARSVKLLFVISLINCYSARIISTTDCKQFLDFVKFTCSCCVYVFYVSEFASDVIFKKNIQNK